MARDLSDRDLLERAKSAASFARIAGYSAFAMALLALAVTVAALMRH